MHKLLKASVLAAGALLALDAAMGAAPPAPGLRLPALFSDHMVLQRGMPVPIWGTAPPGDEVTVRIAGQSRVAVADDNGDWRVTLEPLSAGGPHELVVQSVESVRFSDVLVGEVWLASGQSNMAMPLAGWGRILDYETEIARAEYPEIRLFQVGRVIAMQPRTEVSGAGWSRCSPETVDAFSSTAYFFARRVHRETGLPVGVIHSSWGGTVAEAWTSAETLETLDDFRDAAREVRATTPEDLAEMRRVYDEAIARRRRQIAEEDRGLEDGAPSWVGLDMDDTAWPAMELPSKWEDAGHPELDGVVWFRREVELPADWAGSAVTVSMGYVEDDDETFWNGVPVGRTSGWAPRRYSVPAELVRAGRNVLTVRVVDVAYWGGIWGDVDKLVLERADGERISLAGAWAYRIGLELGPPPPSPDEPNRPSVLFNGMIRPLAPYGLRGVIWYQGESNTERAHQYRTLFPAMIRDWRATWGQGDFPFYFVQLAAYLQVEPEPGDSSWAELREAQAMALALPATGMAVAVDIGDARDVHPKNKQEVGNRLARLALRRVYGREIPDSGPRYREMVSEGRRVRVVFDHLHGGLEAKGGALTGFAVAGEDRRFRWAEARIEGETVVVWSDEVAAPVAARYGWAANPVCNLFNAAGMPAAPFRTDDWPGVTEGADGE